MSITAKFRQKKENVKNAYGRASWIISEIDGNSSFPMQSAIRESTSSTDEYGAFAK